MNSFTLDDAIAAHEKNMPAEGGLRLADWNTVRRFLMTLKAKAEPLKIDTDKDGFILDNAGQRGFDYIDDDIELIVVSSAKLIEFVKLYRDKVS